jgi:mitogen-activated protein kinase-activated protein kinase 2
MGVIMYILLCGYPPFFSTHGGAISAGMKTKIKAGEYQFPKSEWKHVSQEAKSIIQKMLTVDPAARVTIDWILKCPWLTGVVPETPIDIRPMLDDAENYEQMRVCRKKIKFQIQLFICFFLYFRLKVSLFGRIKFFLYVCIYL